MNNIILSLIIIIETINLTPSISIETSVKFAILILTALLIFYKIRKKLTIVKIFTSIFLFFVVIVFYRLLGISTCAWGNLYNQISFFLNIPFLLFIIENTNLRQQKFLFSYLFILIFWLIIDNIQIYSRYGFILHSIDVGDLVGTNYGGTTFNTCCMLFYSACLFVFLNEEKKRIRILVGIGGFSALYYIYFCGARGTVVLLSFIVTVLLLVLNNRRESRKVLHTSLFLLLLILFLIVLSDNILDFLISISPERLAYRFSDIKNTTENGLTADSFSGRYGLYWVSIDSFFRGVDTILFGIGDRRGSISGLISYNEAGIGGHSEILDHCARYGILGIVLVSVIFRELYVYLSGQLWFRKNKYSIYGIIMSFIICAFVKVIFMPDIGCTIFIIIPLSIMIINSKNEKIWL